MRGAAVVAFLSVALAIAVLAACKSDEAAGCSSGDRVQCACPSGGSGLMTCTNGAFGACDCASSSIPDAGSGGKDGGVSTADAGFGQYLGPCNTTADCAAGGECFPFGTKGNTCTHTCQSNAQCEPPSPKCNPKGVCAPPD